MRLSTTNDRVFLELPEAWLNAPEQAAIAEWISNVGTSRPIDGGHVLVELSFDLWHTWAALPSENASEEELDIWTSRHETLARLAGLREQRLDIETVGYIQSRDLELVCRVDGEKVAAGVDAPVLAREPGARLLLPAVFETLRRASAVRPGMDRPAQLEAIGKLKMYATRARRLLAATTIPITISFDDHLDTARFEHVEKAALLWTTSGRNNDLYNLTVEVPDSARGGFKVPVCGRTFDAGLTGRSYAAGGAQRCGSSASMSDAGCVLTRRRTSRRYSKGFTPCASQVATIV